LAHFLATVSKGVILFAGLLFWHDLNYTTKPEFRLLKALTIENPDSAIFTLQYATRTIKDERYNFVVKSRLNHSCVSQFSHDFCQRRRKYYKQFVPSSSSAYDF